MSEQDRAFGAAIADSMDSPSRPGRLPYLNGSGPGTSPMAGNYGAVGTQPDEEVFRKIREDRARCDASLKAYMDEGQGWRPPPAPQYANTFDKIQAGFSARGAGPPAGRASDGRLLTPSEQAIVDNARRELARRAKMGDAE